MNWVQVASVIVLTVAALAALGKGFRWLFTFFAKINQFLDDWLGEPERPGIAPKRPGLMERVANLEASAKIVEQQVQSNGGTSMKDQLERIEERVNQ